MSSAPEDFEGLRRLLKLLRHEQPPPGYFEHFSSRVIRRLGREGRASSTEGAWAGVPWLQKLRGLLETNPLATGACGLALCGLFAAGLVLSQSDIQAPIGFVVNPNGAYDVANASQVAIAVKQPGLETSFPSTAPVFGTNIPGNSMFGGVSLNVQPVSFSPARH